MNAALSSGHFTPQGTHEIACRVYYEDTDAAGIMYYANYLKFAERARTEALRAAGIEQSALRAEGGLAFVVRRAAIEYHAPARLDDVVTVETVLVEMGRVKLSMRQYLRCGELLLAKADIDIVTVGADMRPARIPAEIVEKLRASLGVGAPGD